MDGCVCGRWVQVSAVCPSFHRTNILLHGESMMRKRFQALTPEKQKEYGPEYLEVGTRYELGDE